MQVIPQPHVEMLPSKQIFPFAVKPCLQSYAPLQQWTAKDSSIGCHNGP